MSSAPTAAAAPGVFAPIVAVAAPVVDQNHTPRSTHRLSAAGYQDISIPVYATVKGRASQIRSVPFSGDSSDSSDGEDHAEPARGKFCKNKNC